MFRALEAASDTLADFAEEWWQVYAEPNLSRATLESYASTWDRHVLPRLGGFTLQELRHDVIDSFTADLSRVGVGPAARRRTLMILSSVLQRAEDWGRIPANPVRRVRKPRAKRQRAIRPLAPGVVERIRADLLARGRRRDATLVSVLAYAGVRPGEALALAWEHIRENTILVERANSGGELKPTKTEAMRTVRLLAPLAMDLAEWRLACGRPSGSALVFPNGRGNPWGEVMYRNWRKRIYQAAVKAQGIDSSRPYDLRHSFASLLIYEGASPVEVGGQLGHAPTMSLDTYGHVFDEFKGRERVSAEVAIRAARDELVPLSYPRRQPDSKSRQKVAGNQ